MLNKIISDNQTLKELQAGLTGLMISAKEKLMKVQSRFDELAESGEIHLTNNENSFNSQQRIKVSNYTSQTEEGRLVLEQYKHAKRHLSKVLREESNINIQFKDLTSRQKIKKEQQAFNRLPQFEQDKKNLLGKSPGLHKASPGTLRELQLAHASINGTRDHCGEEVEEFNTVLLRMMSHDMQGTLEFILEEGIFLASDRSGNTYYPERIYPNSIDFLMITPTSKEVRNMTIQRLINQLQRPHIYFDYM